jgi:hypothetical protein
MQKCIVWGRGGEKLLRSKMFVLLRLEIVLTGKNIRRTTNSKCQSYTKILAQNYFNFFGGKFS